MRLLKWIMMKIKRLLKWIMMKIKRLLRISSVESVAPSEAKPDLEEERFRSIRDFKQIFRLFTGQRRKGGPNMPKKQPCPSCGGWRKRARKTLSGAFYYCSRCDEEFYVVNPAAAKRHDERIATGAL